MQTRIALPLMAWAAGCGQASNRPPAEPVRSDAAPADPATNRAATPGECPFQMVIEDVFSISGRGSVVTGRVAAGSIEVGEEIEITGPGESIKARVTGVEAYRKLAETAKVGDDVGLLLAGVTRDQVRRGQSIRRAGERPLAGCEGATAAQAAASYAANAQVPILEGEPSGGRD